MDFFSCLGYGWKTRNPRIPRTPRRQGDTFWNGHDIWTSQKLLEQTTVMFKRFLLTGEGWRKWCTWKAWEGRRNGSNRAKRFFWSAWNSRSDGKCWVVFQLWFWPDSAKNIEEVLNVRKFYEVLSTLKSPLQNVPCNIEDSTKRSSIRCLKKFGWKA